MAKLLFGLALCSLLSTPAVASPPHAGAVRVALAGPVADETTDVFGDVAVRYVQGCFAIERLGARHWHWCGADAEIDVTSQRAQNVRIRMIARTPGEPNSALIITGGTVRVERASVHGTEIERVLAVSPQTPARLSIRTTARAFRKPDDRRTLVLRLDDVVAANAP